MSLKNIRSGVEVESVVSEVLPICDRSESSRSEKPVGREIEWPRDS